MTLYRPASFSSAALLALLLALPGADGQGYGAPGGPSAGRWSRLASRVAAPARASHVAASNGLSLLLAGGAGSGSGAAEGSTTTVHVDTDTSSGFGSGFSANTFVASVTPAAQTGVAAAFGAASVINAAYATLHDASWDSNSTAANPFGGRYRDYLLAFGGQDPVSAAPTGGLGMLQLNSGLWSAFAVSASAATPAPRTMAAGVYLSECANFSSAESGCFIVHGGMANDGTGARADAEVLMLSGDLAAPRARWFAPSRIAGAAAPSARAAHTLVASPAGDRAYLFGGWGAGGVTNDLYVLAPRGFPDAQPSETMNLALGKPVAVSSTGRVSGAASVVTDGRTSGVANFNYSAAASGSGPALPGVNTCFNSNSSNADGSGSQWLRVDLLSPQRINAVFVFTRTDCNVLPGVYLEVRCEVSMQNFEVWAGTAASAASPTPWKDAGNVKCGPAASPLGGQALVPCAQAAARYVYVVLPGANRSLTLCEVEVLQTLPWAWRQLSGTYNAALGAPAFGSQATMRFGSFGLPNSPMLAVDGFQTNDITTASCFVTRESTNGPPAATAPANFQDVHLDLGYSVMVDSVQLWPVLFDGYNAPPPLAPNRTRNWFVYVGSSPINPLLNTLCTGAPVNVGAGPLVSTDAAGLVSATVPCAAEGRYVTIRRYAGLLDPVWDFDNTLAVCEVVVTAQNLKDLPSPRAGHAAATFRGSMFIFGGQDANQFLLNDVRHFDLTQQEWSPPEFAPYGTPPVARMFASLTPVSSNTLVLAGGVLAGGSPGADAFYAALDGVASHHAAQQPLCRPAAARGGRVPAPGH